MSHCNNSKLKRFQYLNQLLDIFEFNSYPKFKDARDYNDIELQFLSEYKTIMDQIESFKSKYAYVYQLETIPTGQITRNIME